MSVRENIRRLRYPFSDQFWFRKEPVHSLALFRVLFGTYLVVMFGMSFFNWQRFYGPDGVVPLPYAWSSETHLSYSLFTLFDSSEWVWFLYALCCFFSVAYLLGFASRTSAVALTILQSSMMHRAPMLVNGQDQVAVLFLFLSCFAPLGATFSVDARFSRANTDVAPVWPQRLMQVILALLYLACGPTKMTADSTWMDGSAVYFVTFSDSWFRYHDVQLFHSLWISRLFVFATLFLETAFAFLVWFPKLRRLMTYGMMALHLGIAFTLAPAVMYFNLVMIPALTLFVPLSDAKRFLRWVGWRPELTN